MLKLLDWLERRIGHWAIPNLTLGLIACQVLVYVAWMSQQPGVLEKIVLYPQAVWQGEVWRLVSFLFVPPLTNVLFAFIYFSLFYQFGSALEQQWGAFRYNAFLLIGWAATVLAAMLVPGAVATNLFLYGSIFLAFARLYPSYQLAIMFILPVEVRWLALLQWVLYGWRLVAGDWAERAVVLASVLNYLLFFSGEHLTDWKQGTRRRNFERKAAPGGKLRHECAVCGRNSQDEPQTAFRYCSQCAGGQCYCPEHVKKHEHI